MKGDIDSVNHLGIAVRDMDEASALYERLGFLLTPLSVHSGSNKPGEPVRPMATGNRCAVFPNNYIEVLGVVNPGALDWSWATFINKFQGAHIICFGCGDASVVANRLEQSNTKNSGVITLQRDIETQEGMRTAVFDCVHFDPEINPEGLIQAAHHRNPEYVHQPRYLTHPNGATSLSQLLLANDQPNEMAAKYARLTGQPVTKQGGLPAIELPLVTTLCFISPDQLNARFPGSLFAPSPAIVAASFSVKNLEDTRALIEQAGFHVVEGEGRFHVPAEQALGVVHEFIQE